MPRISVLLPAHDATATIARAVGSTLRALPADSELVVLDDASTDATADEAARVGDPRVRVLRSTVPSGVAGALSTLLDATDSEVVVRMDADDVSLPWRVRDGLAALDAGSEIVFATTVEVGPGRRVRPMAPLPVGHGAFGLHLLLSNFVCHPTMTARRSTLDALGGYREVPSEDYDLWLRAAARGTGMRRIARPGLLYRKHAAQVTASSAWSSASRRDPSIAAAYGDLSERLLGSRLPRLVALETRPPRERDAGLWAFEDAFRQAAAALRGAERRALESKLRRRLERVRRAPWPAPSAVPGTAPTGGASA
ncbi:glycosyltransferase family 2 protein [Cellulomonas xiejunii]|uniref:glycosyltransferase family 2 protein n=1 Tax=Cellulomonas xiejunii TaxID=2968083 RepID=UPI001D0E13EE|nr:glycosyltransferase family 2 protein [Cellulomonas xiejunii]MCC2314581.1 glycosyltransferase [Cellulomonas xiejunii]